MSKRYYCLLGKNKQTNIFLNEFLDYPGYTQIKILLIIDLIKRYYFEFACKYFSSSHS